ncbi:MAG TPA: PQQ-dependent sugar dehydrogenase [Gammaproteobacteria bacterium]|nr:PQQ-dependent sugar dehydrogenase [Gammaproteobacteria bacterium]
MRLIVVVFLLGLFAVSSVAAGQERSIGNFDSEEGRFKLVVLIEGLDHPWGLAFLPRGRLLVTERSGRLRLIQDGRLDARPIEGLPVVSSYGQGGLLDVALHPQFERNRLVYLSYAAAGPGGFGTEVARGRMVEHRLEDVEVIFRALPKFDGGRHFGSRLVFGSDNLLYISLGDRGYRPNGQDLSTHPGSIIRVHDDGSVPNDNPFVGKSGARPEIFSYGNRNVQGMTIRKNTGELWAHEHGPQGGDEVNIVRAGTNYGWPTITYGRNYGIGTRIGEGTQKEGMAQPVLQWTPSIAPSGMAFYDGDRFPGWKGNLFVGSLKFEYLARLELDGDGVVHQERLIEGALGRIRDVRQGPDGFIYLLTDEGSGILARIEPAD